MSKSIVLLHDNAHPHIAVSPLETYRKLKWQVMEHPAYNQELVLSDFHLFRSLKDALSSKRFSCDNSVKAVMYQWLHAQPKTFFPDGIKKLVGH